METLMIGIGGMSCQGCVNSVTAAIKALAGVAQVDVSLDTGQASILCDPRLVSVADLKSTIEEAGFSAN